jgi:Tfp pilus assembly protein PilW
MKDERGFTLIELLVTMASTIAVLSAILMMVTVATHNQYRIARRVDANQRGRPVMTRIVNELHSACVAPRITPVLSGTAAGDVSTGTQITFLTKSGSEVTPTPEKHVITLTGTTLNESVFTNPTGAAPTWTFSGQPTSTTLLTNVSAPGGVMFRYYDFQNGQLSTTALAVPLSATSAGRTAYVTISLTASPTGGASTLDLNSPITLTDSADLRLESASQVPSQDNMPCS